MSFLGHHNRNHNHERHHGNRTESEEDYCSYVNRLEKKTSMIEGPHFGNMQHAFKREEVYKEVDDEFEASGRFGKAKHVGRGADNKTTETAESFERKQEYLVRAK